MHFVNLIWFCSGLLLNTDFPSKISLHSPIILCVCSVPRSCPTLWNPMDCCLPGSSVHGILQARILEWAAISCSRGTSWPRDGTPCVSCTGRWILYHWHRGSPPLILLNITFIKSDWAQNVAVNTEWLTALGKVNTRVLPWWLGGKELACWCKRHGFDPWSKNIPHVEE